jgi:hypothetical protein
MAVAKDEWRRIATGLYHMGLLTLVDENPPAAYCQAYARWVTAEASLAKMAERDLLTNGLMIKTTGGNAIQNPLVGTANKAASDIVCYLLIACSASICNSIDAPALVVLFRVDVEPEPCSRRCARAVMIRGATGAAEVNVRRLNAAESKEQRQNQCGGDQEDRAIRQEITDKAHEAGRQNASRRCETLIASEALAQRSVADEAKADGSDRQPQEPAGDPLEHESGQHQRETRPNRNDECASCHHGGPQGDDISL